MTPNHIERRLKVCRLYLTSKVRMGNHTRFNLWCGLIINVYDSGKVVVQGHIRAFDYYDPIPVLEGILPFDTAWQFSRR